MNDEKMLFLWRGLANLWWRRTIVQEGKVIIQEQRWYKKVLKVW
jgi:hypothetical protein